MEEIIQVEINYQPIELCKLLKVANLVGGGGEAKIVISEGYVLVNGEVEFQKRKKIYHQDVVQFNGEVIELLCFTPKEVQEIKPKKQQTNTPSSSKTKNTNKLSNKQSKHVKNKRQKDTESSTKPGARKRINFE